MSDDLTSYERTVGRYLIFGEIGAGGMASVHLGRFVGPAGFARMVAVKRLHTHYAKERDFVNAFLDEARIAARVAHPNVASVDDVVIDGDEVLLVMDYVHGCALSQLLALARVQSTVIPGGVAATIAVDMLHGLHAAHTARDERGRLLQLVHRDVSPQNVLVGVDGVSRVLDFGIAKALGRLHTTTNGAVKGKLAYMAPERFLDREVDATVDQYAAAIVLWEMVVGERYFAASSETALLTQVVTPAYRPLPDPSMRALDAVLARALDRDPAARYPSCNDFATAVEHAIDLAPRGEVAAFVQSLGAESLAAKAAAIEAIEGASVPSIAAAAPSSTDPAPSKPKAPEERARTRTEPLAFREANQNHTHDAVVAGARLRDRAPNRWRIFLAAVGVGALVTGGVVLMAARAPAPSARSGTASPPSATPAPPAAAAASVAAEAPPTAQAPSAAASANTAIEEAALQAQLRALSDPSIADVVGTSRSARTSPRRSHSAPAPKVRLASDAGAAPVPTRDGGKSSLDAPSDRN